MCIRDSCTAEHDSLKISNGKWYWWSRGIGGVSALDYLIKVRDFSFVEAVQTITGQCGDWIPPPPAPKKDEPKVLLLPPKNKEDVYKRQGHSKGFNRRGNLRPFRGNLDTAGGYTAICRGAFNPVKLCGRQAESTLHPDERRLVY